MTEAMSRREIEDVLTSIKRLVSQDMHGRAARPDLREKLILTSELRVDPVAAVDQGAEDHETVAVPHLRAAGGGAMPVYREHPVQPYHAPRSAPTSLLKRIAQNRAQSARAAAVPEPTTTAPPVEDTTTLTPPVAPAQPPRARLNFIETAAPVAPEPEPAEIDDSDIEATLARLEAVLAGKPLPDDPPAARVRAPDQPAADQPSAVQPEPELQPRPATASAAETARDFPAEGHEILLDEDMLFKLVADIVRLELQGELGEKITRNIRKLVRAEVARELQLRRAQGMNV